MTDWPLIIGILGFLFGVLSGLGVVMFRAGGHAEKIRSLEAAHVKHDGEINLMQQQLSRGDARFATLTEKISGMGEKLDEIKKLLTAPGGRRRRADEEGA